MQKNVDYFYKKISDILKSLKDSERPDDIQKCLIDLDNLLSISSKFSRKTELGEKISAIRDIEKEFHMHDLRRDEFIQKIEFTLDSEKPVFNTENLRDFFLECAHNSDIIYEQFFSKRNQ